MSIARQHANDLASVAPFERLGAVVRTVMADTRRQRAYHDQADDRARFAIEGGPIQPADVPGASFSPSTTTGN